MALTVANIFLGAGMRLFPIVAVVVIGLIILEGVFRVLCLMPDRAMGVFDMLFGGGAT
jgi:hypothetical protein